jgi:endonuclease/exonuclease/phosphatase family metal-dependent hydrolase
MIKPLDPFTPTLPRADREPQPVQAPAGPVTPDASGAQPERRAPAPAENQSTPDRWDSSGPNKVDSPPLSAPPVASGATTGFKPLGSVVSAAATAPTPTINYNQNVAITNTGVVRPRSFEQLANEIRLADKIRVIGRGHSFNNTLQSEGKHLDLRLLNRSEVSADKKAVWVEAGCIIEDLKARLANEGLSLNTAPMHQGVTVGGGLAMASHGTGLRTSSFSDEVLELEVLDAEGRLQRITDPEELKAARAGLGVAGVVYRAKLGLRTDDPMVFTQTAVDPTELRKTFVQHARAHERADAFYFPGDVRSGAQANGALLRTFDTATPQNSAGVEPMNTLTNYIDEHLVGTVVADKMLSAGVKVSQHTGKLGDWVADTISAISVKGQKNARFTLPTSEAAHYFPGHVAVVTMEYSMPIEHTEQVWDAIDATIKDTGYVPEMAFYFRCLKASDKTLLSPSGGRDSVIMESYQFHSKYGADPSKLSAAEQEEMRKAAAFMQSLEKKLVGLGGRSHPAKIFHVDQKSLYPPGTMERFEAFRSKMDPNQKFMNEWAKGTLGLEQPKQAAASASVDWASAASQPTAPSYGRLSALGDWELGAELSLAWKNFQRSQRAGAPAVAGAEAAAQAERLTALGEHLGAKKKQLELFVGQGIHGPARTAEAKAKVAALDGTLHDLALMAKPLGGRGVQATAAAASSLHGELAVVVAQGTNLELWSRANPSSPQKVADLGAGAPIATQQLREARGFSPGKVGSSPLDAVPLGASSSLRHLGVALGTPQATASQLFAKDVRFVSRPEPGAALLAQHASTLHEPAKDAAPLSVMTYNVALLDVRPLEKQLGGSKAGRAVSGFLEAQAGATLESPDLAARRAALPEAILRSGKDIIMLQEVWNPEDVQRFVRAGEAHGYLALVTPRDQYTDGLMTLVKKDLVDPSKGGIEQRAVTYEQQDSKERLVGGVKRGIQEVRFHHRTLGAIRVANTHAQAYPENWRERAAQMRTLGLLLRDGAPGDIVLGGGDLNAGPYYPANTHTKKTGEQVSDWYQNGMSYWVLMHYSGGADAALAGRGAPEAQADLTAAQVPPTSPGWPHTASPLNTHYAAQYDEQPARLDHLVTAGRPVKVVASQVEFTQRPTELVGPLSDHYGVSVSLQVAPEQ